MTDNRTTGIPDTPAWRALAAHHREVRGLHLRELLARDPQRFERFSRRVGDLLFDFSRHRITEESLERLLALAREADVEGWRARLFAGERVNFTEGRAALHMALRNRSGRPMTVDGEDVMPKVRAVLARMRAFVEAVRGGEWRGHTGRAITDVVNIGIGGSDLGPRMACEALRPYGGGGPRVHFVANVDGADLADTLAGLDPERTLFVVASKTFSTLETLANARSARAWLVGRLGAEEAVGRHFVAVSTHRERVAAFGIDPDHMFGFWDWVGGRYSMWSAIGLPIALQVGWERFEELLEGAHEVDEHFRTAPLADNVPVLMALLGVWYVNLFGAATHAVLPYAERLRRLPAYLQQLEMESNGKRIGRDGRAVGWHTAPVVWGEPGTNGQHAFFQLLHQGTRVVPCEFLLAAEGHEPDLAHHHRLLVANCLAQAEALMRGRSLEEARALLAARGLEGEELERQARHRVFPGNRPSTMLLYRKLTPHALGRIIALYEHRVFTEGVILGINSFDQWGVELGKELARELEPVVAGDSPPDGRDEATRMALAYLSGQ